MEACPQNSPDQPQLRKPLESAEYCSAEDTGQQSISDFGTLGPGSDISSTNASSLSANPLQLSFAVTIVVGIVLGFLLMAVGKARSHGESVADGFVQSAGDRGALAANYSQQLAGLSPQKQAESLLELAIGNASGANAQIVQRAIAERVDDWRGKLSLNTQLAPLATAALNSTDLRVRQSGLDVQLAAYGLAKNASTVDFLIQNAASAGHAQKIWSLWVLGALANRGEETSRVQQVLIAHLKDSDEDSRRWAVEALALVGTTATIVPLLQAMHDDPSPAVRERAACSIAEAGMLSHEQRLAAVPQLVNDTEDASLDSQTQAWAFQALGDITKERLPNDPAAWRSWYASTKGE